MVITSPRPTRALLSCVAHGDRHRRPARAGSPMKAGRSDHQEPNTSAMVASDIMTAPSFTHVRPDRRRCRPRTARAAAGDCRAGRGPALPRRAPRPRPDRRNTAANRGRTGCAASRAACRGSPSGPGTSIAGRSTSMAYQASRRGVGMPAWLIDMTPNQNGDGAGDRGIGRDDVGHRDRHLGVELQRLEAGGTSTRSASDHAMEADRRIRRRRARCRAGRRSPAGSPSRRPATAACWCAGACSCWTPSGIAAAVVPAAARAPARIAAASARATVTTGAQPKPQRRYVRQDQSHQRKVTRVSRPSTCGMLDGSSSSISTCTTRASVDEPPSGSTRCMRFTVGAMREILPL